MKIDLPISDVEEICEFFWYKYRKEHEKYCELQNVLSEHGDEYDVEKHHDLYMAFYNESKYLARYNHWNDILDKTEKKENFRK